MLAAHGVSSAIRWTYTSATDEQLARMMSFTLRYGRKLPGEAPSKGLSVNHDF
jgi:hypothetical protein